MFSKVNIGDNLDKIVDEYTYAELVDPDFYKERLRTHWDTFVTKEDFEKVGSAGVTHIRIPVGYWSVLKCIIRLAYGCFQVLGCD